MAQLHTSHIMCTCHQTKLNMPLEFMISQS